MGVAGAGKSLVGRAFAHAIGVPFVDGDDFHPPANVARMAAGIPLGDADRAGWLELLAARLARARDEGTGLVLACSALKRSYRDRLRAGAAPAPVQIIHLAGPRALIADRLAHRAGHFMPPALLDSQLDTLEAPLPDEGAWVVDVDRSPDDIVATLAEHAARVPA